MRARARFADRAAAGRALAGRLRAFRGRDAVVLALPRGGVAVAREVSGALGLPLDVLVTRKVGAPAQPEYAIGAVAEDGSVVLDDQAISLLGVPRTYLDREVEAQLAEARRRVRRYRGDRSLSPVRGRSVIIVDDGVATGYTALAALEAARALGADEIVVAAPVMAPDAARRLAEGADRVVSVDTPSDFEAVGSCYADFTQLTDEDVLRLLTPPTR